LSKSISIRKELIGFQAPSLLASDVEELKRLARKTRYDVINLIDAAGSGHIGGSFSSMEILVLVYVCSTLTPVNADSGGRDRIVVSHGHISAALYCLLANLGFIDATAMLKQYRRVPGEFEGHPTRICKGIDWGSGSLGHGLSVASGMAIAGRFTGDSYRVFAIMSDGEQAKGQLCEAMSFATKFALGNLTAIIDYNRLQCSGDVDSVMPIDLEKRYRAAGWQVGHSDGHDFFELYAMLRNCYRADIPSVVIAHTVMGKGLPFIENDYKYHSARLNAQQLVEARSLLGPDAVDDIMFLKPCVETELRKREVLLPRPGTPILYQAENRIACRSTLGKSLASIAQASDEACRPVLLDCDVADSTCVSDYHNAYPDRFLQCGISEHNVVSVAGGMAACGIPVVFVDFGVFSLDETYAQLRMNSLNRVDVKIIATHCGLDVGEDGKTHQCIDYISLACGLLDTELLIPADVNQTDHMLRYLLSSGRPGILVVGRTKKPVVTAAGGKPFYSEDYHFSYGRADWLRPARDAAILTCGNMVSHAIEVAERLQREGILCGVLNVCCPKNLDDVALSKAAQTGAVVVYEDHNASSGLGSLVALRLMEKQLSCRFKEIGVTQYGGSALPDKLYAMQGMDANSVATLVATLVGESSQEILEA
jgi:transketolase